MPLEMICGRVTRELVEFASRKYLFQVIEQKYKDSARIREHKQDTKKDTEQSTHLTQPIEEKKDEEEDIIWQIPVEKYRIEDVSKYDRAFLEKIVIYLHNKLQERQPQ